MYRISLVPRPPLTAFSQQGTALKKVPRGAARDGCEKSYEGRPGYDDSIEEVYVHVISPFHQGQFCIRWLYQCLSTALQQYFSISGHIHILKAQTACREHLHCSYILSIHSIVMTYNSFSIPLLDTNDFS